MNTAIRRISVLATAMIMVLMFAASWIQFEQASSLNADERNRRTLYREYGAFRGPIVVDGQTIVSSVAIDDSFGYQRVYTEGELYAPVTGFYSVVYGRTAIEQAENATLNGDSDQLFWARLGDLLAGREQQGASIELTIRASLQRVAADALGDQRGAVVALDPRTGEILAMVSSPSYDPNALAGHDTAEVGAAYSALTGDPDKPLVNRAIAGDTYPPGSVFKLVTTAAALRAGLTPETPLAGPAELDLPLTDATISNFGGQPCEATEPTTLATALRKSCNTPFAGLGMTLGWSVIERQAHDFGWGSPLDIPLAVTASGLPQNPDAPQTAQSAIGQFDVRATPLQVAMVASAIANDGVLMKPYLVARARNADLSVLSTTLPSTLSTPMTPDDAHVLRDMMVAVVDSGTGTGAQIQGVMVAGKTGTAEHGDDAAPHAWFVGFAPADHPVIVVVVLVEDGGSLGDDATGGKLAAPIARLVIEEALRLESERLESGGGA